MSSRNAAHPGLVLSVIGGAVLVIAVVLLVPGINAFSAVTYGGANCSSVSAYLMIAAGAVAFLAGGTLLAVGRRCHCADMKRRRTYADQHDDHTLTAEDRPTTPYDKKVREYQIGYRD